MKTPAQLRARAEELHKKAENLAHASSRAGQHAPGAYITGGSGRSRAQNRATARGLERTVRLAVESGKMERETRYLEARAHAIETAPARAAAKEERKERERSERAAEAALPIANDPSAKWHMTSAEWAKVSKDYRGMMVAGGMRIRTAVQDASRGGGLATVFLTDKPVRLLKT